MTPSRATTFFTLMLTLCYNIQCTELVQTIYRRLDKGGVYGSNSRESRRGKSLTECAVLCQGLKGCSGVEFESTARTCHLYSWPWITYPGTNSNTVWIANDAGLIVASRQDGAEMTHSQAVDLCSSLEGRLPSPQEMYDAHDAGFNLCRCGWTSGGIIRLVLTQADPDCPNTNQGTGVISCKWLDTTPDTFCKFN